MSEHNLAVVPVMTLQQAKALIAAVGSDPQSIDIMAPKAVLRVIRCTGVVLQDAHIIKQDMLSIGGEVCLPKDAFSDTTKKADILLLGTLHHHHLLVGKLRRHYPRLQGFASELETVLATAP